MKKHKNISFIADKIQRVRIMRPYGILVDLNATFNITLFSNHGPDWNSYHGFVHFVWTFDVDSREKPLLTWERAVSHVYTKAGKYLVKVNAINDVSTASATIPILVHGKYFMTYYVLYGPGGNTSQKL